MLKKIIERLFPLRPATRILAAQFSMPNGYQAILYSDEEEIVFCPINMTGTCAILLGANPKNVRLTVSKDGITIYNMSTQKVTPLNFRERRLLQAAVHDWVEMEGTLVKVASQA